MALGSITAPDNVSWNLHGMNNVAVDSNEIILTQTPGLSGWDYKREIIIDNTNGTTETNETFVFRFDNSNFDFSKTNSDGSDIRFTANDGQTLLNIYIGNWDTTNQQGYVVVKVPSVPVDYTTIYMYYGNASTNSVSSVSNTIPYGTDFEGGGNYTEINTDNGGIQSTTYYSPTHAYQATESSNEAGIQLPTIAIPNKFILEMRLYLTAAKFSYMEVMGVGTTTNVGPSFKNNSNDLQYAPNASSFTSTGFTFSLNQWYHFRMEVDTVNLTCKGYVDEQVVVDSTYVGSFIPGNSATIKVQTYNANCIWDDIAVYAESEIPFTINDEGPAAPYAESGTLTSPIIDIGASTINWTSEELNETRIDTDYSDPKEIEYRGSNTAPSPSADGTITDTNSNLHDYWLPATDWGTTTPSEWTTIEQYGAITFEYIQLRITMEGA